MKKKTTEVFSWEKLNDSLMGGKGDIFKIVFESANVGKSITLPSGEMDVNKSFCKMLGYTPEELRNRSWQELTPQEEIEEIKKRTDGLLRGEKESERFEKRYIHKNGSYVWADVSVTIHRDNEGKPLFFITTVVDITKKKQTELELCKREEQLEQSYNLMNYIIEHSNSAVAVHDKEMKYMYVSQRYLRDYNVEEKDVIGRHHYEVFPDLPQKWRDVHKKVLAGEIISAENDPYIGRDGMEEWTRWECRPWYEQDGEIGGLIVYTEVITNQVKEKNALHESEENYRMIAENISDVVWASDLDLNLTYVSPSIEKLAGESPEDHIKRKIEDRIPPDSLRMIKKIFQEEMESMKEPDSDKNRSRIIVTDHYHADGSIFTIAMNVSFLWDLNGNPSGFLGVSRDITKEKKVEEELKVSEEIFRQFMENSPIYVFFKDKDIRSVKLSRNFEELLGRPLEDIIGKTMDELFPSDLSKNIIEDDKKVLNEGKPIVVNEELNGKYYTTIKFPILIDGEPQYLAGYTIDITEQKNTELEIIKLKDGLEIEVEKKTRLLQEKVIELERFFDATVDRELRMEELYREIEELRKKISEYENQN